jgi:hypothetical protein
MHIFMDTGITICGTDRRMVLMGSWSSHLAMSRSALRRFPRGGLFLPTDIRSPISSFSKA